MSEIRTSPRRGRPTHKVRALLDPWGTSRSPWPKESSIEGSA
jgi:hypothetical protein